MQSVPALKGLISQSDVDIGALWGRGEVGGDAADNKRSVNSCACVSDTVLNARQYITPCLAL